MANFGSFSGLIYLQKSVYQYVMTKKESRVRLAGDGDGVILADVAILF